MNNGRRGLILKWAAGVIGMLAIGGGNILGTIVQKVMYSGGMVWENAETLRWCVTGGVWLIGLMVCALAYALGAALEKIDILEMWLSSLDTAVRNQKEKD